MQSSTKKLQLYDLRKKQKQKEVQMTNEVQNQTDNLKKSIVADLNKFEETS